MMDMIICSLGIIELCYHCHHFSVVLPYKRARILQLCSSLCPAAMLRVRLLSGHEVAIPVIAPVESEFYDVRALEAATQPAARHASKIQATAVSWCRPVAGFCTAGFAYKPGSGCCFHIPMFRRHKQTTLVSAAETGSSF